MVQVGACTGACCAAFYLPTSHAEYENGYLSKRILEGQQIQNMVLPIGADEAQERIEQFGGVPFPTDNDYMYACRNWSHSDRRCKIYERRPKMCSDYPYGTACHHCGETAGEVST